MHLFGTNRDEVDTMRKHALLAGLGAIVAPVAAWADEAPARPKSVFDGDYVIVGVGLAAVPSYEGSDDGSALPLIGATGEIGGVGFTIRGPSLSLDIVNIDIAPDISIGFSPQVRYRSNRNGGIKDEVVARLGKLDGVVEAGGRIGIGFDELLSRKDKLSMGVSVRWDASGKGSGYVVTPSATYRLPLNRHQAIGILVSTQFVNGDYADYNYAISQQGSLDSGLPVFDAKGGFKEWSIGFGAAQDLSGDVLDGGFAVAAGVIYSRLNGSAAKTPITSMRGSRDQWFTGAGLAYIF